LLQVSDLAKDYPTARGPLRVLDGVSFNLAPGDAAAIMGPSGSGKSSLLYILGGLEPPTAGAITLDEVNPYGLGAAQLAAFRNTRIGFVFQDHCLLPQCTVLENVLIPTLVSPKPSEDMTRARQLVEQVGLADRIDHRPAELSGGERQRVAIARALVRQPRLLLCDEPTGNLDTRTSREIMDFFTRLNHDDGLTVILVTHDLEVAQRARRALVLIDGEVVVDTTDYRIAADALHRRTLSDEVEPATTP
jgi:ABC-type lipoprotein export system ATPase subunit